MFVEVEVVGEDQLKGLLEVVSSAGGDFEVCRFSTLYELMPRSLIEDGSQGVVVAAVIVALFLPSFLAFTNMVVNGGDTSVTAWRKLLCRASPLFENKGLE